jgi:hypothetical protein
MNRKYPIVEGIIPDPQKNVPNLRYVKEVALAPQPYKIFPASSLTGSQKTPECLKLSFNWYYYKIHRYEANERARVEE